MTMPTLPLPAPLKWSDTAFRTIYRGLKVESPEFKKLATVISEDKWVTVNHAVDSGKAPEEAFADVGLPNTVVDAFINIRVCLARYKDDIQKLADCLAGRLDA